MIAGARCLIGLVGWSFWRLGGRCVLYGLDEESGSDECLCGLRPRLTVVGTSLSSQGRHVR